MKYWDEVLYPSFLATIGGERYENITNEQLKNELNELTKRAISVFKFPKVKLNYILDESTVIQNITIERYAFVQDNVNYKEIAVLIAWMKFFWAENQISNSDNFVNLYFDANIRTFSPGNTIHNLVKFKESALKEAEILEYKYYQVDTNGNPTLGHITDE